jgi:ABC-type multidrug transport system fused ATPase/permease subunit
MVKKSVYWMYFAAMGGIAMMILVLLVYIITETCRVMNTWWVTFWSNNTANKPSLWYVGIYALLALCSAVLITIRQITLFFVGLRASRVLHDGLIEGIMRSPMSFFDQTPLGRITNRISKDIYTVDKTLPSAFGSLLSCLFQVIASLVVTLIAMPLFIVVLIPMCFYYLYEQQFYMHSSREVKRLDSISRSPIYANVLKTFIANLNFL